MPDPPLSEASRRYLAALDHLLTHRRGSPAYNELTDRVRLGVAAAEECEGPGCTVIVANPVEPDGKRRVFCSVLCGQRARRAEKRALARAA